MSWLSGAQHSHCRDIKALPLSLPRCWRPCSIGRQEVATGVHCLCCRPPPPSQGACFPFFLNTCFLSSGSWPHWEAETRKILDWLCDLAKSSVLQALSIERGWRHQSWMFPGLLGGLSKKIVVKAPCQLKINIINNYFVTFILTYIYTYTVCSESLAKALLFFHF